MKKREKHSVKLIRQFAYMISAFVITTITVAAIVTYFSQMKEYRKMCRDRIMEVGDYLVALIMEDPEDFLAYQRYYDAHYGDIRIPYDFTECISAKNKFYQAFSQEYPGKTFRVDVMPDEMSDELQNL